MTNSLEIAGVELREHAVHSTPCGALGLELDKSLVEQVIRTAPERIMRPVESTGHPRREAKAQSIDCRRAAKQLMQSVVETVFTGENNVAARGLWLFHNVNYYEEGDFLPMHPDYSNSTRETVIIISLCGTRELNIADNKLVTLEADSIAFLDGWQNPVHSAKCTSGPSVSIVADVPGMLY